jgi:hypothetical protein
MWLQRLASRWWKRGRLFILKARCKNCRRLNMSTAFLPGIGRPIKKLPANYSAWCAQILNTMISHTSSRPLIATCPWSPLSGAIGPSSAKFVLPICGCHEAARFIFRPNLRSQMPNVSIYTTIAIPPARAGETFGKTAYLPKPCCNQSMGFSIGTGTQPRRCIRGHCRKIDSPSSSVGPGLSK